MMRSLILAATASWQDLRGVALHARGAGSTVVGMLEKAGRRSDLRFFRGMRNN